MKAHHYLSIIVRLFSVFLFLYALGQTGLIVEAALHGTIKGIVVSAWLPAFLSIPWLVVSAILWFFPMSIAKKIVPLESDTTPSNLSPISILAVLLTAMSVYFLYYAVVDTLYWITFWNMLQHSSNGGYPIELNPENKATMYSNALELFSALVILFNSKRIAARLHSVG